MSSPDTCLDEVTLVEEFPPDEHQAEESSVLRTVRFVEEEPEGSRMTDIFSEILAGAGPHSHLIEVRGLLSGKCVVYTPVIVFNSIS